MEAEKLMSGRINLPDIRRLAVWAEEKPENRDVIWSLVGSENRKVSVNALWVMTHISDSEHVWIASLKDRLVNMLLIEKDISRKRLLLHLLRNQEYTPDDIRTDFLDFCLSKINSECEPYAVRAFSIHTAFKMCRHFPELLEELGVYLDMLNQQTLSPGLVSARLNTIKAIQKIKKLKS